MKKLLRLIPLLFFTLPMMVFAENTGTMDSEALIDSTCSVSMLMDSTNNPASPVILTAMATGTAPYVYEWSTGETSQTIAWIPNGANYCVTVTDADGCMATDCLFSNTICSVTISPSNTGTLTTQATGQAPFTYLWSNGTTTPSITPNAPGFYCVTITTADGCTATACYQFTGGGSGMDSCGVVIVLDSVPPGSNGWLLTAIPNGTAPYTYQWNIQNWQTPSIQIGSPGNYCVTVTDATGCVAEECITIWSPGCSVTVSQQNNALTAVVNANAYTFLWNTGETTQTIFPDTAGTYCVTVTGNGCTSTDCHYFQPFNPNISQIQGYVYLPDSLNSSVLEGFAELYQFGNAANVPELVSVITLQNNPNGWFAYYDFGQVAAGVYLVKVSLDPTSPYYDDYLPTYYGNVELWNNATQITIPGNQTFFNITFVEGDSLLSNGGSGQITGNISDGEGFTGNIGGNRDDGPLEDISILLYNSQEEPLTHTLTDANGDYAFSGLPFGTYKLVVEIVGQEQAERWVTLSADNPVSEGNDFEVTEEGIVSGLHEMGQEHNLAVFPNPAKDVLSIRLESAGNFEGQLSLTSLTGQTVLARQQDFLPGSQTIVLNMVDVPFGIYFLQITTGREVVSVKVIKE